MILGLNSEFQFAALSQLLRFAMRVLNRMPSSHKGLDFKTAGQG